MIASPSEIRQQYAALYILQQSAKESNHLMQITGCTASVLRHTQSSQGERNLEGHIWTCVGISVDQDQDQDHGHDH